MDRRIPPPDPDATRGGTTRVDGFHDPTAQGRAPVDRSADDGAAAATCPVPQARVEGEARVWGERLADSLEEVLTLAPGHRDHARHLTTEGRRGLLAALDRSEAACTAVRAGLVAAEADSQDWRRSGYRSANEWRAATSCKGPTVAGAEVRMAQELADLPAVNRSLSTGQMTADHARVIARATRQGNTALRRRAVADGLEDQWVRAARGQDAPSLARRVARDMAQVDPRGAQDDFRAQHAARFLRYRTRPDGSMAGEFCLDVAAGQSVRTVLDAHTTPPTKDDVRSHDQRLADAWHSMADLALGVDRTRPGALLPTQVTVIMREDTAAAVHASGHRVPGTPAWHGQALSLDLPDHDAPDGVGSSDGRVPPPDVGRPARGDAMSVDPATPDRAAPVRTGPHPADPAPTGPLPTGPPGSDRAGSAPVVSDRAEPAPAAPVPDARPLREQEAERTGERAEDGMPDHTGTDRAEEPGCTGGAGCTERSGTRFDPRDPSTLVGRRGRLDVPVVWGEVPPATYLDGTPVPPSVLEAVLCDCALARIVIDAQGVPVDLGRSTRLYADAVRRAVIVRDGGTCAYPGCTMPAAWSNVHHIDSWCSQGSTSVANGVTLCVFHHQTMVHARGVIITPVPGGFRFTWPDGRLIGDTLHVHRTTAPRPGAGVSRSGVEAAGRPADPDGPGPTLLDLLH